VSWARTTRVHARTGPLSPQAPLHLALAEGHVSDARPVLPVQYSHQTHRCLAERPTYGGETTPMVNGQTPAPHRSCAAYRNRAMPVFDSKSRYAPALDGARNPPRRETRSQQTFGVSWWVYQRHPTSRLLLHLSGVGPPSAAALRCPEPTTCCRLTLHPSQPSPKTV
jgi:hypothetical protein